MSLLRRLKDVRDALLIADSRISEIAFASLVFVVGVLSVLPEFYFNQVLFAPVHAIIHETLLGALFMLDGAIWWLAILRKDARLSRRCALWAGILWGALAGFAMSVDPISFHVTILWACCILCVWIDVRWQLPRFALQRLEERYEPPLS